jgi:multisubunit Na+/H+ antiporter MnhG subunit
VSAGAVAVAALVALGTGLAVMCCVGVLVARTSIDRLHYAAAAGTLPPVLFAAAVWVQEGAGSAAAQATVTAAILLLFTPVLTVATARAIRRAEERPAGDREGA